MSVDLDKILDLIGQDYINRSVLSQHDLARESFNSPQMIVEEHDKFKYIVTAYVKHHMVSTGEGEPSDSAAFGTAKGILDRAYEQDRYQEGYPRAQQMAHDGTDGGMRGILNEIADGLKRRALGNHLDDVFHEHIDVLSKEHSKELSRAFYNRFGSILTRADHEFDEDTFAWNTRAALDYYRALVEQVVGIHKKM